jgi:hypothetical protein
MAIVLTVTHFFIFNNNDLMSQITVQCSTFDVVPVVLILGMIFLKGKRPMITSVR